MLVAAIVLLVAWWELRKLQRALEGPRVVEHIVYLAPMPTVDGPKIIEHERNEPYDRQSDYRH